MKEFSVADKYRLELHWTKALFEKKSISLLKGCFFSGPVVSDIVTIQPNDYIDLDFVNQYLIFVDYFYIAKLSWGAVERKIDKIFLQDVVLENKNINAVPKLQDTDYILIDTSDHTETTHHKNLTYKAYLLDSVGSLYNFRG